VKFFFPRSEVWIDHVGPLTKAKKKECHPKILSRSDLNKVLPSETFQTPWDICDMVTQLSDRNALQPYYSCTTLTFIALYAGHIPP
jgi:hypothetical protein